jgi:hypothetical protein
LGSYEELNDQLKHGLDFSPDITAYGEISYLDNMWLCFSSSKLASALYKWIHLHEKQDWFFSLSHNNQ